MNREATDLAGVRHITYETLGSTNAEALALARAGERGPLWITAPSQSAGRGRRGSTWVSPPGNLYATLLLSEPSAPDLAPQLSFVAALALHDAVARLRAAARAAAEGEMAERSAARRQDKLAGILIEGESEPVFAVAIGIGVNCASHPRRHGLSGDRSCAGRRAGRARRSCSRRCRRPCCAGSRNGSAGRALRPSAPTGSSARRRSRRGHPRAAAGARAAPAASRGSTRPAGCWSSSRRARRPSPPAKCSAWAEPDHGANRNRNWCSRRSAASARSA